MKEILNEKEMEYWLNKYHIRSVFSAPDITFRLFQFEKHEYLNNELDPFEHIIFVVSGMIRIQHIRENGSLCQIASPFGQVCLGDMEFVSGKPSEYLVEVMRRTICVAVPLKKHRTALKNDPVFLFYIASELSKKIEAMTAFRAVPESLPERVLYYLKEESPDHELCGLERTASALSCSKRQLIRVLNKLCEEEKITRTGRGKYRLADM